MGDPRSAETVAKVARTVSPNPYVFVSVPRRMSKIRELEKLLRKLPGDDRSRLRIQEQLERFRADTISGLLRPIPEHDWLIHEARISAVHLYLRRQTNRVEMVFDGAVSEDEKDSIESAMQIQLETTWNQSLLVEALFRARTEEEPELDLRGNPIPCFRKMSEVRKLDQVAVKELVDRYLTEFHVTDEDLGGNPSEPAEVQ